MDSYTQSSRNIYFALTVVFFLAFGFFPGKAQAQVSQYIFAARNDSFNPILSGTRLGGANNDDEVFTNDTVGHAGPRTDTGFPIGFTFFYNNMTYDHFAVNTNGWIILGNGLFTIGASSTDPLDHLQAGGFESVISGFGADLQAQSGSTLRFQTLGVSPNRVLVVQWINYRMKGPINDSLNFQIRLDETTNYIHVLYGEMRPANTSSAFSGEVGLRGMFSEDYNNRITAGGWANSHPGQLNSDKAVLTNANYPAHGINFTWNPPPACSGFPVAGTTLSNRDQACPGEVFMLSLAGTSWYSGLTYQWQSSSDGNTWVNITGAIDYVCYISETASTYYRCLVKCGVNTSHSTSLLVKIKDPAVCYCDSTLHSNSCTSLDVIDSVSIPGTTLANAAQCPKDGTAYAVYPSTGNTTAMLIRGNTYSIRVTSTGADVISMWIDYNRNAVFEPSEYKRITFHSNPNVASVISFTVPANATVGPTGMRIRTRPSGLSNDSSSACVNFFDGETQDYTLFINFPLSLQPDPVLHTLELYPNPAKEELNLNFQSASGQATVRLLTPQGKACFSETLVQGGTLFKSKIALDGYAKGLYLLEVITNDERVVRKVLVD